MARPDELYEADTPFLHEAFAAPSESLEEAMIGSFARIARRVPRGRRRHLERAFVRQLAHRGLGRRSIAIALAALRRRIWGLREAEGEEEALEAVDHELSGCSGGAGCPHHESEDHEWEADSEGEHDEAEYEALDEGEGLASDEALEAQVWGEDSSEAELPEALFESEESEASEQEVPFLPEARQDETAFAESLEELHGLNQLYEGMADLEQEDEEQEGETAELEEAELLGDVEMEGEVPSAAEIKTCLDSVKIVRTQQLTLPKAPNPFDLNAIASRNSPDKRGVFKPLQSTWASLRSVEAAIAKTKTPSKKLVQKRDALQRRRDEQAAALKAWVRKHPLDHSRKRSQLKEAIAKLERRVPKLKGQARAAGQAELEARKGVLTTLESTLQAAAQSYEPLKDIVQNHHEVQVPGRAGPVAVRLHDHVIAYATDTPGGFEGHAANDTTSAVPDALKRSGLSASKQSMLRVLSSLEGYFSSVNTWDRAVITFGFIQWTTDEAAEGTLCKLMAEIRGSAPDAYKRCFQCYGLDLDGKYFKITRGDGSTLVGPEAARYAQTSLPHVAALSAAGMDVDVQSAQVRFAAETKIDGMLARKLAARGKSVTLGDLLTSDYAVAVMMDRATGTGENGTRGAAERAFAAYVRAHPDADFGASGVRDAAGAAVLRAIENLDRERAGKYAALSHDAGSYSA